MTTWVEPTAGRQRGPRGLLKAWIAVLVAPRRFFASSVSPGDQGPGLLFAVAVVALEEASRYVLSPGVVIPVSGTWALDAVLWLAATSVLVTPLALHAVAAIETLLLVALAPERGGTSETVQVLAYAGAPLVFAGIPVPAVRLLAGAYAFVLLVVGLRVVHAVSVPRAVALAVVPWAIGVGYGFRWFGAAVTAYPPLGDLPDRLDAVAARLGLEPGSA